MFSRAFGIITKYAQTGAEPSGRSRKRCFNLSCAIKNHWLLYLIALSLFFWCTWYIGYGSTHPFGDFGNGEFTDHFSHMNAARLFTQQGLDTWRKPLNQLYRPLSEEELDALPSDLSEPGKLWRKQGRPFIYYVPGFPSDKPMAQGWWGIPRFYPPGDMLLVAPIAFLYNNTSMSFTTANRLLILYFLAWAHVALYLFLRAFLRPSPYAAPCSILAPLLAGSWLIYWALQGFFDVAALVPLLLCAAFLAERRALAAIVAYCVAAALQFRAFFLAPWVIYAAWLIVKEKQWRSFSRRDYLAVVIAAALALCSLVPFAMVFGTINGLEPHNLVYTQPAERIFFLVVFCIAAITFVSSRAWLDVAVVVWVGIMFMTMPGVYPWYFLFLLPWLAAPLIVGDTVKRSSLVMEARLLAIFVAAILCSDSFVLMWPVKFVQFLIN